MESAAAAEKTIEYFGNNRERMKDMDGELLNEPVGSGSVESTCRQMQCRMKRCGQFSNQGGDEALMAFKVFGRNDRWEQIFSHVALTSEAIH